MCYQSFDSESHLSESDVKGGRQNICSLPSNCRGVCSKFAWTIRLSALPVRCATKVAACRRQSPTVAMIANVQSRLLRWFNDYFIPETFLKRKHCCIDKWYIVNTSHRLGNDLLTGRHPENEQTDHESLRVHASSCRLHLVGH